MQNTQEIRGMNIEKEEKGLSPFADKDIEEKNHSPSPRKRLEKVKYFNKVAYTWDQPTKSTAFLNTVKNFKIKLKKNHS